MSEPAEPAEPINPDFQERFLSRLAEKSFISRDKLDHVVGLHGFKYLQLNTLYVYHNGYKHFGSDLLKAYRENPARATSKVVVNFPALHEILEKD